MLASSKSTQHSNTVAQQSGGDAEMGHSLDLRMLVSVSSDQLKKKRHKRYVSRFPSAPMSVCVCVCGRRSNLFRQSYVGGSYKYHPIIQHSRCSLSIFVPSHTSKLEIVSFAREHIIVFSCLCALCEL